VFFICGEGLANEASAWGGQQDPWSSGKIIALLTVGCVVLIGFFCYGKLILPMAVMHR
jgi:hypothetical protein